MSNYGWRGSAGTGADTCFEQKRHMLNMAPRQIPESSGRSAGLRLPVGRDHVSVSLAQCLAHGRSSRNVCHTGLGGTNGDTGGRASGAAISLHFWSLGLVLAVEELRESPPLYGMNTARQERVHSEALEER